MPGDLIRLETRKPAPDWRERALVVCDPVRFTRNLTVEMLRQAGARRVRPADNPRAAAWLMRESRNAVLIADWREDFAAGPGLIRQLRRDPGAQTAATAPTMLISDPRSAIQIEQARDAGASVIALRPLPVQGFIDRLSEITARPRSFVSDARFTGPDRRAPRPPSDDADPKRQADIDAGRTTPIEAARAEARSIIFEKLRRNDPLAARVGRSLERFLLTAGAIDGRAGEIITLHRATLGKLDDHREAEASVRLEIVASLERLVERRAAA